MLSIDCGTQSLRAMLFSATGELIDNEKISYEPYFSPKPGWAEQDPEILWQSLCKACQKLKEKQPELFENIAGVGITTQRNTMINVDKNGAPLRNAITWLDQRKSKKTYTPNPFMVLILKAVGMYDALSKTQTDGKCNWIIQNEPDIWSKTYKYLQVSGFLNFRLTGSFLDSIGSQIGHIPFDYKKMKWSKKGELSYSLFPVEIEKLSDLVMPGELIGKITSKASNLTGIKEGIPVVACGSDKGCETIGMGVVDKSKASLSFGTTATVQTTSKNYFEAIKFMPPYPAVIPGYYNPEVEIFRGYWMITWFKNEFGYKERIEAEKNGVIPEIELNKMLEQVPPGSMGLMLQPLWGPGLKHPEAKGAMIGFGGVHTRAHVYRAVIEGLAYSLLDGLHSIEKASKTKIREAGISGGASMSDEICQISADIFNLPLYRGVTHETSGLGAAIVTSVGLKLYEDFEIAIKNMVKRGKTFHPNGENRSLYNDLYKKVYKKMYGNLKHLYKDIRDITGYPERI